MKHPSAVRHYPPPIRLFHPCHKQVYCVHCYQILGRAQSVYDRDRLLLRHRCVESALAKAPASPPPYN